MDGLGRVGSFLAGIGRGVAGVFQGAIAAAAKLVGMISRTASRIADDLGRSAAENLTLAAANFGEAFGSKVAETTTGQGPLAKAVEWLRDKAKQSAGQIDQAAKQNIGAAPAAAATFREVKAIDSRSKEGVAEMFRLMRGDREETQERIAKGVERIADNTDDLGTDVEELNFAW